MKRLAMLFVFAAVAGGLWWMNREAPSPSGGELKPGDAGEQAAPGEPEDLASEAEVGPEAAAEGAATAGNGAAEEQAGAQGDPEVGVTVMPTAIGTGFQALRSQPAQPTLEEAQEAFLERVTGWADDLSAEADIGEEHHPMLVELLATWSNDRALAGQSTDRQVDLERQARSKFELSVVRELGQDEWDRIEEVLEDEPPWLLDGR